MSMDISDPLLPLLPITLCFWLVLRATSRIGTVLLYGGSSWSSCLCSAMWRGPPEYITYELFPTSPAVSRESGSSNFDSFLDGWLVAVQLLLCGVLSPGLVQYYSQHSCVKLFRHAFSQRPYSASIPPYRHDRCLEETVLYFISQTESLLIAVFDFLFLFLFFFVFVFLLFFFFFVFCLLHIKIILIIVIRIQHLLICVWYCFIYLFILFYFISKIFWKSSWLDFLNWKHYLFISIIKYLSLRHFLQVCVSCF